MAQQTFPTDLLVIRPLKPDPANAKLSDGDKATLKNIIQVCRDAIVFFTAVVGAKGLMKTMPSIASKLLFLNRYRLTL